MPEFYDQANCRYQLAAQPYLAAIARGMRDKPASRAFLLKGLSTGSHIQAQGHFGTSSGRSEIRPIQ